jgi:hypothetical protein
MDENNHQYSIEIPAQDGDLYFTVESYYEKMVPESCTTGTLTAGDGS